MRILIVDDDMTFLEGLRHALARAGHRVETARNGVEALEKYRAARGGENRFRLMLVDWEMPALNGPDLCRAIRAEAGGRDLYIIMLTGWGGAADVDGRHAGADDFLCKPFEMSDLLSSIRAGELVAG